MPMPFDATLKDLVQAYPRDYEAELGLAGVPPVAVLNVDLSTVTAATDIVLRHGDPITSLVDINFQASRAEGLAARILLYNALLHHRYRVPVHSVIVLLRPAAEDRSLDEGVQYTVWPERGRTEFHFEVLRLWDRPVERLLSGGLGTLPLAPLCQLPAGATLEAALPGILRRIDERLLHEARPESAAKLWAATFVLSGLRLPEGVALPLFQGVRGMRESSTYQYILREGATEEVRKILLLQGAEHLGDPNEAVRAALERVTDLPRLERMAARVHKAANWQDLLETA